MKQEYAWERLSDPIEKQSQRNGRQHTIHLLERCHVKCKPSQKTHSLDRLIQEVAQPVPLYLCYYLNDGVGCTEMHIFCEGVIDQHCLKHK